jgi:hypothetical protein
MALHFRLRENYVAGQYETQREGNAEGYHERRHPSCNVDTGYMQVLPFKYELECYGIDNNIQHGITTTTG